MYILIELRIGGIEENMLISKSKAKIVVYLNKKGYYYSNCHSLYINKNDNSIDYKIEKIDEI